LNWLLIFSRKFVLKQIIAKVVFALLAGIAAVCLLAPQAMAQPDAKTRVASGMHSNVGTGLNTGVTSDFISGDKSVVNAKVVPVSERKFEAMAVAVRKVVPCEIGKVEAPASVKLFEVDPVATGTESWDKFASGEYDCFVGFDARSERHQR
jgi:hypothetical protein